MAEVDVKKFYAVAHAKWYDPLYGVWNTLIARKANRDLKSFLHENLTNRALILELGCGTGRNLEKIQSDDLTFKHYVGIDFSSSMLGIAKKKFKGSKRVSFEENDVTKLDTQRNFDVIISTWMLSHLDDRVGVVNNAQDNLKSGGKMFLICFSEPHWLIRWLVVPITKYLLKSSFVTSKEFLLFKNVKKKHSYLFNSVTTLEIHKPL